MSFSIASVSMALPLSTDLISVLFIAAPGASPSLLLCPINVLSSNIIIYIEIYIFVETKY